MKKIIFGLFIIALSIPVLISCGTAPEPASAPTAQQARELILDGATNYTVVRGDTLADIAARRYGGSNMYFFPLIRLANAGIIPDPDVIEVGMNLVIPDLQRNLNNDGSKAVLKADMLSIAGQYERQSKPRAAATLRNMGNRL